MSEVESRSKQAEHVLFESQQLFRAVWEYASDAMALSISDGTVIAANPAYFHLYGFPQEDVIGNTFPSSFPRKSVKRLMSFTIIFFRAQHSVQRLLVPFAELMAPGALLNPVITLFHTRTKE